MQANKRPGTGAGILMQSPRHQQTQLMQHRHGTNTISTRNTKRQQQSMNTLFQGSGGRNSSGVN